MDLPKIIDNKLPFDEEFISEVEHCCWSAAVLFRRSNLQHSEQMANQLEHFFKTWRQTNNCMPTHSNHSEYYF